MKIFHPGVFVFDGLTAATQMAYWGFDLEGASLPADYAATPDGHKTLLALILIYIAADQGVVLQRVDGAPAETIPTLDVERAVNNFIHNLTLKGANDPKEPTP